jgi:hypothetical protein
MSDFITYLQQDLSEGIENYFLGRHDLKRATVADEIYELLQFAYRRIGGLRGSGFNSAEDMLAKIPFWKFYRQSNKIIAVILYKDKGGRKSVALGTDGSRRGAQKLAEMIREDVLKNRSYGEFSGPALAFVRRQLPAGITLADVAIPFEDVKKMIPSEAVRPPRDDEAFRRFPELRDFFYSRELGGEMHTKVMLGMPGLDIH